MVVRTWAGKYDQRITVKRNKSARAANADGQRPEDSETFITRWGSVTPTAGRERMLALQTAGDVTHLIRMRRDTSTKAITADYWFELADGRRLNVIRGYDLETSHQEMEFEARERA